VALFELSAESPSEVFHDGPDQVGHGDQHHNADENPQRSSSTTPTYQALKEQSFSLNRSGRTERISLEP
jgi:hypothetical protein